MGAWGPGLFSDDVACDVRDTYRELLEDGVDDEVALRRVLDEFGGDLIDDDEPVVWLALAVTMSKVGRLTGVRDRALELIDSGRDLQRWERDPKLLRKRRVALEKVRSQLEGPQPERRRLRPSRRHVTDLEPGLVLAYGAGGWATCFRVVRIDDSRVAVAPILVALDYGEPAVPAVDRLEQLRDRLPDRGPAQPDGTLPAWHAVTFWVFVHKKVDYADVGFTTLGRIAGRQGDAEVTAPSYCTWAALARELDGFAATRDG